MSSDATPTAGPEAGTDVASGGAAGASTADTAVAPSPDWRFRLAVVLVVLASVAAVYAPVISYGYAPPDDRLAVLHNPFINPATLDGLGHLVSRPHFHDYRPVGQAFLWLEVLVFGRSPEVLHAISLVLHVAVALMLLRVLLLLVPGRRWLAFAVVWVWVVHPINVEPVVWIKAQDWLLSALLGFGALWVALRHAQRRDADQARLTVSLAAPVLLGLALLAKSGAVVLAPLFLLADWLIRGTSPGRATLRALPMLAAALAVGGVTQALVLDEPGLVRYVGGNPAGSLLTHLPALARNLSLHAWPFTITPEGTLHPGFAFHYHVSVVDTAGEVAIGVLSGLALIAVLAGLWVLAGRTRLAAFAALWYLGGQALVSGVFPGQWWRQADRYNYICAAGLFLLVALAASRLWHRAPAWLQPLRARIGVLVLLVAAMAAVSSWQRQMWSDPETFNQWQLDVQPRSIRANYIAGMRALEPLCDALGRIPPLAGHIRMAPGLSLSTERLERALAHPDAPQILGTSRMASGLARLYVHAHWLGGDPGLADVLRQALIDHANSHPREAPCVVWAAWALLNTGRYDEGVAMMQRVLGHREFYWQELQRMAGSASEEERLAEEGHRWMVSQGDFVRQEGRYQQLFTVLIAYPRGLIQLARRALDAGDRRAEARYVLAARAAALVARYLFPWSPEPGIQLQYLYAWRLVGE